MQADISEKLKKLGTDDERGLKRTLEGIRTLYYQYRLVGEIEITKAALMTESVLVCEVDGTGEYVQDVEPEGVKVSVIVDAIAQRIFDGMVHGVDKLLNDLIHRSKAYWHKSYKDDMTLAGTFSWSDPKGYFTWTVGCSATIKSMHDYLFSQNEFELTYAFGPDGKSLQP